MGLQFDFLNFGQFGFFFLMSSLGVFGFDLMNMPNFQLKKKSSGVFNYFLLILDVSILFFLQGDGVFELHLSLLFCLPCDGSNHWLLL
jgi:hypothetical protein